MKITKICITELQSIRDSTKFEIGYVNCLVGKNKAGETALKTALYRLNTIIKADGNFDVTDDYPPCLSPPIGSATRRKRHTASKP